MGSRRLGLGCHSERQPVRFDTTPVNDGRVAKHLVSDSSLTESPVYPSTEADKELPGNSQDACLQANIHTSIRTTSYGRPRDFGHATAISGSSPLAGPAYRCYGDPSGSSAGRCVPTVGYRKGCFYVVAILLILPGETAEAKGSKGRCPWRWGTDGGERRVRCRRLEPFDAWRRQWSNSLESLPSQEAVVCLPEPGKRTVRAGDL